jgi:hypothetical protein
MAYQFQNNVSNAQAITGSASIVSTDSIELGTVGFPRDIGEGEAIYANAVCTTTCVDTSGTDATLTIQVIGASDAGLTADIVVLGSSGPFGVVAPSPLVIPAGATTGGVPVTPISVRVNPAMFSTATRFIGVRYIIASGPFTAGAFTTFFAPHPHSDSRKFYPSGWTVA